jgi:DNA-binding PadR family transcriptional regulator
MSDVRTYLPLSPQQFHILLALVDGHLHGYGIIREILDRTGGALRLGTGTLYTALARLDALALIEESARRPPADNDDERRRYYQITPLGRAVVTAETERLDTLVRHARRKGILPARRPALSSLGKLRTTLSRAEGSRSR